MIRLRLGLSFLGSFGLTGVGLVGALKILSSLLVINFSHKAWSRQILQRKFFLSFNACFVRCASLPLCSLRHQHGRGL